MSSQRWLIKAISKSASTGWNFSGKANSEPMADEKLTNAVPTSEPQSPASAPAVRDKRILPEGVVPKQAQGYVVAGLAVLILLAVMFSKNHAKPAPKETASSAVGMSTDVNQRKIQELEQDLSADQRQSQQRAQAQKSGAAAQPATNAARLAARLLLRSCRPLPNRPAIRSRMLKRRWPSKRALPRISSPPVTGRCTPSDTPERTPRHADAGSLAARRIGTTAAGSCRTDRCREWQQACAGGERQLRARPALCASSRERPSTRLW